ncbi:META domain-containing protein [Agromyces sp. NPDC055520]
MSRTLQRLALSGTILLAATMLAACAGDSGTGPTDDPVDPVGTWGDVAATGEPSLVLGDDGSLTGTDGCNRLTGTWTAEAETVTFVDVASTRMLCEGVDTWLAALATGTIAGDTLTVFDGSDKKIGTLDRSDDAAATGTDTGSKTGTETGTDTDSKTGTETGADAAAAALFVGTWGIEATGTGEPFITIAADGTASGNDGCNGFSGTTWTLDGDTITFAGGATTLMACEGVDPWLGRMSTAVIDGDTMIFFDTSWNEIGTLQRTA